MCMIANQKFRLDVPGSKAKLSPSTQQSVFSIEAEQEQNRMDHIPEYGTSITCCRDFSFYFRFAFPLALAIARTHSEQYPQNVMLQPRRAADNANCDVLGRWSNCDGGFVPHVLRSTTWPILMKVSVTALLEILTHGHF